MNEKFTKGEWRIDEETKCAILVCSNGKMICDVSSSEDDAHLIAAAPDMYRALAETTEELAKLIDMYNAQVKDRDLFADGQTCHESALVLAKARGEI